MEEAVARLGVPYRNNYPGFLYGVRSFPDFLLPTLGLVIEVDDPSHSRAEKVEADAERTELLAAAWGVRVVRCTNDEALADADGALRGMLRSIGLWPLPSYRPALRDALPQTKKCPQKTKREAKSAARQARRQGSPGRRRRVDPPELLDLQ